MLGVLAETLLDLHAELSRAERFALSVLAEDQEHLSVRFAADRPDRFTGVPHTVGPDRLPLVDGAVGAVWARGGRPRVVFAFEIADGKVVQIDLLADPERLQHLNLEILKD